MSIKRPLNVLEENKNEICQYHKTRKLIYTCKDCGGVPACSECVTSEHHGHRLARMQDMADDIWKDLIHHYIYKSEKIDLPKVQKEVKIADRKMDENRKHYQEIAGELQKKGDELKEEIDRITLHALEIANGVAEENTQVIKIYKNALLKQQTILQDALFKCKKAQGTQDFTIVHPIEKHIRTGVKLPKVPFQRKIAFKSEDMPKMFLEKAYGTVQVLGYKPKTDFFATIRKKSPNTEEDAKDAPKPPKNSHIYQVESQFRHHSDITHMCCTFDDCAWICNKDKKELLLITRNGEIQQKTATDVHLSDMGCSQANGNLWFCSDYDYSVRELTSPTTSILRFRTPFMPCTMSMSTRSNRVVAATFRKVSVFDVKGEELYSTDKGNTNMQRVASPVCVRACPMSGNIAILDADYQAQGGLGIPHVTVLTSTLGMLFKYYGSRQTQGLGSHNGYTHKPQQPFSAREPKKSSASSQLENPLTSRTPRKKSTSQELFNPVDICYDAAGHLFIADQPSKSILMIGSNGQYLKTVFKDNEFPPQTISFQTAGVLWVGFNYGIVKVIKYSV